GERQCAEGERAPGGTVSYCICLQSAAQASPQHASSSLFLFVILPALDRAAIGSSFVPFLLRIPSATKWRPTIMTAKGPGAAPSLPSPASGGGKGGGSNCKRPNEQLPGACRQRTDTEGAIDDD